MVRLHSPLPFFIIRGRLAQLGEHLPYKQRVIGSSPIAPTICGLVVQLVRMPACHAGGRRFEPVPGRQFIPDRSRSWVCLSAIDMVGIVKRLRPRVVAPVYVGSNPTTHPIEVVGVSPSGKATDSDSVIRRFESCYPSQFFRSVPWGLFRAT